MSKITKTIYPLFLVVGFIGFLVVGYYTQEPSPTVVAQEYGTLRCNGPIVPNGSVSEDVIELLDTVYRAYQDTALDLQAAISHAQIIWASLNQTDDVCDFSKCRAEIANNSTDETVNIAPDFGLILNAYIVKAEVGIRPGICDPGPAVGDPCSIADIRANLEQLQMLNSSFLAGYMQIHNLFATENIPVTADTSIKKDDYLGRDKEDGPENADPSKGDVDMLTPQEEVRRKIEVAEGLIDLCTLSELERKQFKAGKRGNKKLEKCIDALKNGTYEHPEPWSEACKGECSAGPTQTCVDCLGECKGTSILARMNCRIYSLSTGPDFPENCSNGADPTCCGNVCRDDYYSRECDQCLSKGLDEDEFESFLCGGSVKNWICCSAVPLEK